MLLIIVMSYYELEISLKGVLIVVILHSYSYATLSCKLNTFIKENQ